MAQRNAANSTRLEVLDRVFDKRTQAHMVRIVGGGASLRTTRWQSFVYVAMRAHRATLRALDACFGKPNPARLAQIAKQRDTLDRLLAEKYGVGRWRPTRNPRH